MYRSAPLALALLALSALPALASVPADTLVARINDQTVAAGVDEGGVRRLRLVATETRWFPESDDGPSIVVQAFAEEGAAPSIPGPLIRVEAGTEIVATVRNALAVPLVVHGLHARPGPVDSLVVAPGETVEARFTLAAEGTWWYSGTTGPEEFLYRYSEDANLTGGIVVDPPGGPPAPDRVFLITWWFARPDTTAPPPEHEPGSMMINGKSWPHTERLSYAVGDTARMRWINATEAPHPMHLHGFFFHVDRRGTMEAEAAIPEEERPFAVTERVPPGGTFSMSWVPNRPGNWLLHCHFTFHVAGEMRIDPVSAAGERAAEGHDGAHRMAGLVLGLHVDPGGPVAADPPVTRRLRLVVDDATLPAGTFAYGLGDDPPSIPGPPIVLTSGEAVAITVVNRLDEPTSVHWHGIELLSYSDGVPGWSGEPGRLAAAIAPGDSFVAEYVAPRRGTYMYHSHFSEVRQIDGGLYGPILVLDPGETLDPAVDRVVLISGNPDEGTQMVNGAPFETAPPIEIAADRPTRLRLVNIMGRGVFDLTFRDGDTILPWRAVAKDGAEVPRREPRAAPIRLSSGEIADFEVEPPAGATDLRLVYQRQAVVLSVPVRVR